MEVLGSVFNAILRMFKLPMTIYGFTFSWWDVFLLGCVISIVIWFLREVVF